MNLDPQNILDDDLRARLENLTEGFPKRRLAILPLSIAFHLCVFGVLFASHSSLVNITLPQANIIQVDIVPELTLEKPIIKVDPHKIVPVEPDEVDPQRMELIEGEKEVQPDLKEQEETLVR